LLSLAEYRAIHNHDGSGTHCILAPELRALSLGLPRLGVLRLGLGQCPEPELRQAGPAVETQAVRDVVVLVDMQQEYRAKPQVFAIAGIDRALDNCRKVPDHPRRTGLPVAFIRMFNAPAIFNRATPLVRWTVGFEPCRNEMLFEQNSRCCCYSAPFTAASCWPDLPAS
jgi:hypothetical protein